MQKQFDRKQKGRWARHVCPCVLSVMIAMLTPVQPAAAFEIEDLFSFSRDVEITWAAPSIVVPDTMTTAPATPPRKPKARPVTQEARAVKPAAATAWDRGLQAWRKQDYARALSSFTQTARGSKDAWTIAGAWFWAARAADATGDTARGDELRARAAKYPHTFYGQLAARQMGADPAYDWDLPVLDMSVLTARPGFADIQAAMAAGKMSVADQKLRDLAGQGDKPTRLAALVFAVQNRLPATAYALVDRVEKEQGLDVDAARYPLGAWVADGRYTVDRALVHAIIRQESRFDPSAQSPMGATGLMQLMPATAKYVIKTRARGLDTIDLNHSVDNISVGQDYVTKLMAHPSVNSDLIKLLVAYNAGPGNLAKWQKTVPTNDPLLFIETIPAGETRAYVERVMAAYWVYRDRLGQGNPSRVALAGK